MSCFLVFEAEIWHYGVVRCTPSRVQLNIQQRPLVTSVLRVPSVCLETLLVCPLRLCVECGQRQALQSAFFSSKPAYQRRFLYLFCSLPSAISSLSASLAFWSFSASRGCLALAALL